MNQKQRAIAGTVTIALIVAAMFYIPWRIESSGNLTWAPFYRNPVVGKSFRITESIETRFTRLKGRRLWGVYAFQLALIGSVGAGVYWYARDKEE